MVNGIVNHDVLLTPQQGYHWQRSKRVYYKDALEQDDNDHHQVVMTKQIDDDKGFTPRPWEHTLKHVTYLTIFVNSSKDSG